MIGLFCSYLGHTLTKLQDTDSSVADCRPLLSHTDPAWVAVEQQHTGALLYAECSSWVRTPTVNLVGSFTAPPSLVEQMLPAHSPCQRGSWQSRAQVRVECSNKAKQFQGFKIVTGSMKVGGGPKRAPTIHILLNRARALLQRL